MVSSLCQFLLRHPMDFRELKRFAVLFGKLFHHRPEPGGDFRFHVFVAAFFREDIGEFRCDFYRIITLTVVIDDSVARNLVDPCLEFCLVFQFINAAVDFDEDFLKDVFRVSLISNPARDEVSELNSEIIPELVD